MPCQGESLERSVAIVFHSSSVGAWVVDISVAGVTVVAVVDVSAATPSFELPQPTTVKTIVMATVRPIQDLRMLPPPGSTRPCHDTCSLLPD